MTEQKSYTVHRSMLGDKEYERGDTRKLTPAEAKPLIDAGALSEEGEEPKERQPAVQHTFGARKSEVEGYTSASGEGVKITDHRPQTAAKAKAPAPAKKA
jgi:hypothetical protein